MTQDNERGSLAPTRSMQFISEVITLRASDDLPYLFELEPDERLDFIVSSTHPIDLVICNSEDFETWVDSGYDPDIGVPVYCEYQEVTARKVTFKAPHRGEYAVVLMNWGDHAAELIVEIPDYTASALR